MRSLKVVDEGGTWIFRGTSKVNYDRMWRPARDLERGPISTDHLQLIALCGFHSIEFMIGVFGRGCVK